MADVKLGASRSTRLRVSAVFGAHAHSGPSTIGAEASGVAHRSVIDTRVSGAGRRTAQGLMNCRVHRRLRTGTSRLSDTPNKAIETGAKRTRGSSPRRSATGARLRMLARAQISVVISQRGTPSRATRRRRRRPRSASDYKCTSRGGRDPPVVDDLAILSREPVEVTR